MTPVAESIVAELNATEEFVVSFDLTPRSASGDWPAILHTGPDDSTRGPASVWFSPDSTKLFWSYGYGAGARSHIYSERLALDTEVTVRLVLSESTMYLCV